MLSAAFLPFSGVQLRRPHRLKLKVCVPGLQIAALHHRAEAADDFLQAAADLA